METKTVSVSLLLDVQEIEDLCPVKLATHLSPAMEVVGNMLGLKIKVLQVLIAIPKDRNRETEQEV